jgi:aminobenzoyl-glutamate transport protein
MTNRTPTLPAPRSDKPSWLDFIERLGNKLPEPALLFLILTAVIIVASGITTSVNWRVPVMQPTIQLVPKLDAGGQPVLGPDGKPRQIPKLDERGKPIVTLVPKLGPDGRPTELTSRSLLTGEGVYWLLSSMVRNFTGLPALGLVFVSMLGIGLAEKFGLFSTLMRQLALLTPKKLLTPVVVFIGANSSVASDAGYIILPPLAAALYLAVGRSPIAGLAAAFAGVAGGFGGGLFPTAADGFLAGVATQAAHIIDPAYPAVNATHNLYFKIGSAIVVMLGGWFVTDRIIEPRLNRQAALDSRDTSALSDMALTGQERRGLAIAGVVAATVLAVFGAMIFSNGAPLNGIGMPELAGKGTVPATVEATFHPSDAAAAIPRERVIREGPAVTSADGTRAPAWIVEQRNKPVMAEPPSDRWAQVIVPMILLTFLLPGVAYGLVTRQLRTQADFIEALYCGIRSIVPVLAIAFFLGQFVNCFQYTGLDRMLAYSGGSLLVRADVPVPVLIVLFVMLVILGDFAMSGMLSKFGVLAPIFIPMFMMVGMSPELTTAAYRIGDSVVNIITPLNSYLLIILAVLQKYKKHAGLGSLISLMLPYSIALGVMWTAFLLVWYFTGAPLGFNAPLDYIPAK